MGLSEFGICRGSHHQYGILSHEKRRHSGHSRADPAKYRPEGELDEWKKRDPIKLYKERLASYGVSDAQMKHIDDEVMQVVNDATEACKASPTTSTDILFTDVYADGGWAWRN